MRLLLEEVGAEPTLPFDDHAKAEQAPLVVAFLMLGGAIFFSGWVAIGIVLGRKRTGSDMKSDGSGNPSSHLEDDCESPLPTVIDGSQRSNEIETGMGIDNPVLLSWDNISCTYGARKGFQQDTTTLVNAWGEMRAGQLTAIMGPSGSGKSTLLSILAGRKATGKITGNMSILGERIEDMKKASPTIRHVAAYVPPDEAFFPMQTAEEAVNFVAKLKHGRDGVDVAGAREILREVGLGDPKVYSRPIGGALAGGVVISGLSSGEKKRLALACALAMKPQMMLLDEVTSGLDSENALETVELVKRVCVSHNVAAIIIIHQPSGHIFKTFDRLVLLSNGECVFSDDLSRLPLLYEHRYQEKMPESPHELPVDILKKLKEQPEVGANSEFQSCHEAPVEESVAVTTSWKQQNKKTGDKVSSVWKLRTFFHRNLINHYIRNPTNLAARLLCYAICSLLDGCIFWQVGADPSGDGREVIGALTFVILISFLLPFATIPIFVHDKKFFMSERSLGLYPPLIFCVSQILLEMWVLVLAASIEASIVIPMCGLWNPAFSKWESFFSLLSALIASGLTGSTLVLFFTILMPSQDLAFLLGSGVVTTALGLSGGFVPFSSIEDFISWLQWMSPCKYSLQALTLGYYTGTVGEEILDELELNRPSTITANMGVLYGMFALLALTTTLVLSRLREKR